MIKMLSYIVFALVLACIFAHFKLYAVVICMWLASVITFFGAMILSFILEK